MKEVSARRLEPPGYQLFVVLAENKELQGEAIHVQLYIWWFAVCNNKTCRYISNELLAIERVRNCPACLLELCGLCWTSEHHKTAMPWLSTSRYFVLSFKLVEDTTQADTKDIFFSVSYSLPQMSQFLLICLFDCNISFQPVVHRGRPTVSLEGIWSLLPAFSAVHIDTVPFSSHEFVTVLLSISVLQLHSDCKSK